METIAAGAPPAPPQHDDGEPAPPKITIANAAERYDLPERYVRYLVRSGQLAHYRLSPRRILLDPRDIERLIASARVETTA